MFSDQPNQLSDSTVLSSGPESVNGSSGPVVPSYSGLSGKKIGLIVAAVVVFGALVVGLVLIIKKSMLPEPAVETVEPAPAIVVPVSLPDLNAVETATTTITTSSFSNLAIEYLSFADFYKTPDNFITSKLNDYQLPLNVKIDVMNYYDVSRKLDLDPALETLGSQGFAIIDNPWAKEAQDAGKAADFYSVYSDLDSRQLPLMITSDFMIYAYQNILKKAFKDVEENVFYDNLWEINKELYTVAKNRYEARLAAIGNVNDPILEGERLETAFFAVALEILKPTAEQLVAANTANEAGFFTSTDAERFYFVTPPYLKNDVLAEVKLIREAKAKQKSPVMLYHRDYAEFVVPSDYKPKPKLNNFYLGLAWINSVFPLNYRDKNCPACLIDKADWRVNMIAASFIAKDFSELPGLKNKWARIYKVMSFFKGLRDDLSYVHYRDSLSEIFGKDYNIEILFDDANKDSGANLEKLRAKVAAYEFKEINGALGKTDPALKPRLGFKLLAESYWPNNYIFGRLTSPAVGALNATTTEGGNITACANKNKSTYSRCNGFALDIVNLINPIGNNNYFNVNTDYSGYEKAVAGLRAEVAEDNIWHFNGYWTNLSAIKALLSVNKANLPLFTRSSAWQDKTLRTAAAAWINLQLPLDKPLVGQAASNRNLNNAAHWNEDSYVEPNLELINELVADTEMLTQMFAALQLDLEVRVALRDIKNFSESLAAMRSIVKKELTGEELSAADNEAIANFTKQVETKASDIRDKQIVVTLPQQKDSRLKEDLSRLKLMLVVHQEGVNKIFSVGPVWDYQESR